MENSKQPLLSLSTGDPGQGQNLTTTSSSATFIAEVDDIPPITGAVDFFIEFSKESKKLWYLAGPAIFTSVCQYSLGAVTQVFAGHVSTIALAAVSVENSVIAGFSFGAMQLLSLIGQTPSISKAAGTLSIWMIPQLFAYAVNFPIAKFLQAQSKMMVMAIIAASALVLHTFLSWLLMLELGWGLVGAAVVLNASWWFIDLAQMFYIFSGTCGRAWNGFSWKAFHNLWAFVRLSLASAVMLCLEVWYFMALILFAGYLKNAELSVDALSICMNILGWTVMVAIGMNAAISVRVSNELGAAHPRTAKFSLVVAVISSFLIGLVLALILIITKNQYPSLFSNDANVRELVIDLTPLLALCIVINNIQPVLSGVAIGAGWQAAVAYVNIGCYYLFGIPLGLILGYKVDLGVKGIWCGMISGTVLQTLILFGMIYRTNWNKEASIAEKRIRLWGGHTENDADNQK
ncbi:protein DETOXIFICATION 29 [Citrus sinensis]|uniref:Protein DETOXIFICATION 29 n=1 Tax=Citrus sinensis TaxID=2711 RepID=A0ACB8LID8_CITSI|nr:protein DETOXIFICATION 29 [Citrus sinensis]